MALRQIPIRRENRPVTVWFSPDFLMDASVKLLCNYIVPIVLWLRVLPSSVPVPLPSRVASPVSTTPCFSAKTVSYFASKRKSGCFFFNFFTINDFPLSFRVCTILITKTDWIIYHIAWKMWATWTWRSELQWVFCAARIISQEHFFAIQYLWHYICGE